MVIKNRQIKNGLKLQFVFLFHGISYAPWRHEWEVETLLHWVPIGASWRWALNIMLRPFYPRGRTSIPIEMEAGWAPGPFCEWLGMRYSPISIRNPDHPARNVVSVMTELRRAPYWSINALILRSAEELTFRKRKVSLKFIIPPPSRSLPLKVIRKEKV